MPELPEVETVRTQIEPLILDRTIVDISIGAFSGVVDSLIPDMTFEQGASGRRITSVGRRAKYLLVHLDNRSSVVVHLRMTGRLLVLPFSAPEIRFQHVAIHLDNNDDVRFGDQRKFGRLILAAEPDLSVLDARLGPEPWSRQLTANWLQTQLARRPGPIKGALLDQHLIAGLGNIYVDEALFRSRIHPLQPARTIESSDLSRLLRAIRHVLGSAIERQGTTFSTFENPYGEPGRNAEMLRVYGKGGTEAQCPRCRSQLVRAVVAGRGTSYCPSCQPLRS